MLKESELNFQKQKALEVSAYDLQVLCDKMA